MWTPEPFLDTSKRHKVRTLLVIAFFMMTHWGCVVTDAIEFEEKINNPPKITETDPSSEIIDTQCIDQQQWVYRLTVHDPDPGDDMDARITIHNDPYDGQGNTFITSCSKEPNEGGEDDLRTHFNCTINNVESNAVSGVNYLVKAQVSDRGYNGNILVEGAEVAEVIWFVDVITCQ